MVCFMTERGKVIYDAEGFFQYLNSSLGLTKEDVLYLCGADEEKDDEIASLRDAYKEYELIADDYSNRLNSLCSDIKESVIPKLISRKGGTKKQIAEELEKLISYYEV